ncbi:MAG: SAM-dependent methyltransferase [marine bacterium B5-7]|nr:MAG: SAM-dependent methyltransferase [marine bacterium B5-7]
MRTRVESLPLPSADESAHAERVANLLRRAIDKADGVLPFDRFMSLALYAPGLGYYSSGAHKFGAGGDFVTAPELGSLFTRCLAGQCAEILEHLGEACIVEFGAGSGALCVQLLESLDVMGRLPQRYLILEPSAELRARQMAAVGQLRDDLASRVEWLGTLPDNPLIAVVIANEVLDAMPVTRFRSNGVGGDVESLAVGHEDGKFIWRSVEPQRETKDLQAIVDRYELPKDYVSEYNGRARAWVGQIGDWLERGVALLIDYGYPQAEYYHAERDTGTLKCFFHHHSHDDPLILTGIQDITAHVDFSALATVAEASGLDVLGYTSQGSFLLGAGLMDVISSGARGIAEELTLAAEVKRLTLPSEMGELFKVMALGRDVSITPSAFKSTDRSGLLHRGVS